MNILKASSSLVANEKGEGLEERRGEKQPNIPREDIGAESGEQ